MKVWHYGLACDSEENADRFYEQLLGLRKGERKTIPAALCGPLFGIPADLAMVSYAGDQIAFEVFLHRTERPAGSPNHVCLEVDDLDRFLERCRAMQLSVTRVPRGDRWITFVEDFAGNRFELKPAPSITEPGSRSA